MEIYIEAKCNSIVSVDRLLFSSNSGSVDLEGFWFNRVIKLQNGEWSWGIKTLGDSINYPRMMMMHHLFITDGKKPLYFSLRGHQNHGGFDVFKTKFKMEIISGRRSWDLDSQLNTTNRWYRFVISEMNNMLFSSANSKEVGGVQSGLLILASTNLHYLRKNHFAANSDR